MRSASHLGARVALALVFAAAVFGKLRFNPSATEAGLDAAYYTQIARHVADGEGLLTSFSVFHQGLEPLPQPTVAYPLWPLVLGYAARVVGLERAAAGVPELLYLVDLALAALLATRAARPVSRHAESVGAVTAALLATNFVFFYYSSIAYTEALAVGLVLACLLCVDVGWRKTTGRGLTFAVAGLAAGLAYATRYQLLVVPMAVGAFVMLADGRGRGRRDAATLLVGALVPMALVAARVAARPAFKPWVLVDHSAYRQSPLLPPVPTMVEKATTTEWLTDRLLVGGVAAFDPTSSDSYVSPFAPIAYAAPLAALALLLLGRERRGFLAQALSERWRLAACTGLVGFVAAAPLQFLHALPHFREWGFGHRQGLFAAFLFFPAAAWLVTRRAAGLRAVGALRVATSLAYGAYRTARVVPNADPLREARGEAARWLDAQPERPRVMGLELQPLSAVSRAHFYWLGCWSDPEIAATYVEHFKVDTVVLKAGDPTCRALAAVRPRLVEVARFGQGEMAAYRVARP